MKLSRGNSSPALKTLKAAGRSGCLSQIENAGLEVGKVSFPGDRPTSYGLNAFQA